MKQAVKDGGGNDIIQEDLAPLLGCLVRGHDDRAFPSLPILVMIWKKSKVVFLESST